jgi:PAS domain S-box-containing protein
MGEENRDPKPVANGTAQTLRPATLERITAAWQETTEALRDSERRYRELVEYSLGLICTHDLAGHILSINPAAASSLGYEPGDGIGRNLRDFLAPSARHLFDEYLKRIQEEGHDAGLMRVVSRTGTEKVWMYRNVMSRGSGGSYVLGHAIDVTDRVTAERTLRLNEQALRTAQSELEARVRERTLALEEANDRLRIEIAEREEVERSSQRALIEQRDTLAFLANFSDRLAPLVTFEDLIEVVRRLPVPFLADWTMVHVVNDDGSVRFVPGVHAERAQERLLGAVAVPNSKIDPLSHLGEVIATGRLAILTLNTDNVAASLIGAAGRHNALLRFQARTAAMLPLMIDGRVKAVLSLLSTREHRFMSSDSFVVEDVARRIGLALDRIQLYREAHEANRLKDEFLGTLSHELRTPLNAIFGWARILRTRDLDTGTAHAVEVIQRNAEAQVRLIEEVLDVSRIVKGKMTLASEPLDVAAIVRATVDTVRPAIHAKRIRLEERVSQTPTVLGDAHRLQQVFWNLLSNALKFTGSEGTITITLRRTGRQIEFEIADTGVGIRREVLPFIFDRFRQADSSTTRTYGGLGLGLAIVRNIVELHGGTVHAASAGEGHGATFTIHLPTADSDHAAVPGGSVEAEASGFEVSATLQGRTILIVEDHEDARDLIKGVLEGSGASVLSASTTREAIDLATGAKPDAVVADLGLPGEDGFVLLTRIRTIHPDVPVLALTAYARTTDRDRALAAGFAEHVVKPVDPKQLVQLIDAFIRS